MPFVSSKSVIPLTPALRFSFLWSCFVLLLVWYYWRRQLQLMKYFSLFYFCLSMQASARGRKCYYFLAPKLQVLCLFLKWFKCYPKEFMPILPSLKISKGFNSCSNTAPPPPSGRRRSQKMSNLRWLQSTSFVFKSLRSVFIIVAAPPCKQGYPCCPI